MGGEATEGGWYRVAVDVEEEEAPESQLSGLWWPLGMRRLELDMEA